MRLAATAKPVRWVGSSLEAVREFPRPVRRSVGYALQFAQAGTKHPSAKPLKGFRGAGVLEVVEDHRGNTYRAVYTVRLSDVIYVLYVLHAFQKKSKSGIKTPRHELDLIHQRLRIAKQDHQEWTRNQPK